MYCPAFFIRNEFVSQVMDKIAIGPSLNDKCGSENQMLRQTLVLYSIEK